MRVVTAESMQKVDKRAIEEFGVPGLTLMENAGRCCVDEIIRGFGLKGHAVILAGKGNNGGDGYVIARLLSLKGWSVKVIILADREQISGDAAVNLEKLPPEMTVFCTKSGELSTRYTEEISQTDIIIDALFGTGLASSISGIYLEAVNLINSSNPPVLSVDIPSGVNGTTGLVMGGAVRADITVTFAAAKLGHVLFPGSELTGRLVIADIGIPAEVLEAAAVYDFLDRETIRPTLRRRQRTAHKGDFGHCLIIAGSRGKTGAAALSANSAVRAGSGLVTLAAADSIHDILEAKTTEVMTSPLPDTGCGHLASSAFPAILELLAGKDAVAIGPGLGQNSGTAELVRNLVETVTLPMVIDADGLNALAEDITVFKRKKSAHIILTPHPGEMARLLGVTVPEVERDRISVAREFAREYGVFLILKGARTIIAAPDGTVDINGSGNPGMATGGMGDVLTGIIVSLLGQGYTAGDACRLGVFIHGFAADMVADEKGETGMNATDVQEMLPFAFKYLLSKE